MKRQLLLVLLAAGLAAAPGCADKRDAVPGIRITPSIKTRVTGLHFDTGDCIGLTVTKNGSDYVRNHQMTYDGSAFTASGLLWYNDLNETSTLTAYFPYSASGVPDEFSVARDQSAGCASSDLLGAVAKNVTPTGAPVGMLFYHLMSQLTIVITNNSDAAVSGVAVGGFVPTASVDLSVPTASAKAGVAAAEIETFEVTPDASYRAILVPQQGALTVTVSTRDGKSRSKTLSSATLESGRRYDMSVLVTNIDIELKLSGEVSDWEDGGSLGEGDGGEASELEYGGDTYRTAKIGGQVWMAENLRYVPDEALLTKGIWYPDGNEDAEYVREHGMLYSFTAALGGAQAVSGAPVRGICPAGWHVPYIDELQTLAAGSDFGFTLAGMWNSVSKNYVSSAKSGYLMSAATDDGGSSYSALLFYASGGNPSPSSLPAGNGVSLRCVKDAK